MNMLRLCQRWPMFSQHTAQLSLQPARKKHGGMLLFSEEVKSAFAAKKPVVALETTIVTHGMPYPQNINTAMEVEDVIRNHGAVPASIGILKGKIHVGLTRRQMEILADPSTASVKTSRRDLSVVLFQRQNGGTTVSGTMVIAHLANIPIFVTGGIGGVHRGAETSMDISADLTELGRTPVTVVSAGVKSILDIGRTLEYLETQGVCVASYGESKEFPAFFSRTSGFQAPYNVTTPLEAAEMIAARQSLGLQSGTLVAVPIPSMYDTLGQEIEGVIQRVVTEAQTAGISGKEVTPYILQRVNEATKGKSLEANIHLIKNNADVGAKIAVELNNLVKGGNGMEQTKGDNSSTNQRPTVHRVENFEPKSTTQETKSNKKVTVVGGSIVDFTSRMTTSDFKINGATYTGSVEQSFGGVGRNIADGLSRLGVDTLFLSAIGNDSHRSAFEAYCKHMNQRGIAVLDKYRTATYCANLRSSGELMFGIGDMDIHTQVTPQYISQFVQDLSASDLVCVDGNITVEALQYVCEVCRNNQVPVFYEPTDLHKASKPFQTSAHNFVTYSSPNYNELRMMEAYIKGHNTSPSESADDMSQDSVIEDCVRLLRTVAENIPVTMVTMGHHGVLMCHRGNKHDLFPVRGQPVQGTGGLLIEHFPATPPGLEPTNIVSVSGAGDCMVAAFISKVIQGEDPHTCVKAGLLAAQVSLTSHQAVPATLCPSDICAEAIAESMNIWPRQVGV